MAGLTVWLRAGGIQLAWLVILGAGAATSALGGAHRPGWSWVSPTDGFQIVIAAGVERIFGRTTEAAVALDRSRRELARKQRTLMAPAGPCVLKDDRFALYARPETSRGHSSGAGA